MINTLDEGTSANESETTINGMPALQFEVVGKAKVLFHPQFSYLVTLLEGDEEFVVVTVYTKTNNYATYKSGMSQLAARVTGIGDAKKRQLLEQL